MMREPDTFDRIMDFGGQRVARMRRAFPMYEMTRDGGSCLSETFVMDRESLEIRIRNLEADGRDASESRRALAALAAARADA